MPESRRVRAVAAGVILTLVVGVFSVDYTVQRGDTLARIAKEHGVSVSDLVAANDISNPNLIFPGQVLVIPGEDGEPAKVHIVARGDTLSRIASTYGTSLTALVSANAIPNPDLIRIGQEILIPSGSNGGGGNDARKPAADDNQGVTDGVDDPPSQTSKSRTGAFHIVKRGETLESIAAQYQGVSASQIANANGIINGVIFTGTRLFLDGPEFVARGSAADRKYKVKRGDRLVDIARTNETTVARLVETNSIPNPNLIRIGQELVIPSGTAWVCPVESSTFFNDWGFPRGNRWHEGNDLFAAHGTPVRAPVSGEVEFKTGSIGGMQFNLRGDDGVTYIGSHLSGFGTGGKVEAGQVVGFIGTTGNAQGTRPHLHFGMYLEDGTVINPYPTLIAHGCK